MGKAIKIAVVAGEPDAELARMLKGMLRRTQYEAIEDERLADLVIALNPPYEAVQAAPRGTPFIVVTTAKDVDCILEYTRVGADDVVVWDETRYEFRQNFFEAIQRVRSRWG